MCPKNVSRETVSQYFNCTCLDFVLVVIYCDCKDVSVLCWVVVGLLLSLLIVMAIWLQFADIFANGYSEGHTRQFLELKFSFKSEGVIPTLHIVVFIFLSSKLSILGSGYQTPL